VRALARQTDVSPYAKSRWLLPQSLRETLQIVSTASMDMNARLLFKPSTKGGMLVGGVVIDDQMQRQPCELSS
jgi:hypothetical protein